MFWSDWDWVCFGEGEGRRAAGAQRLEEKLGLVGGRVHCECKYLVGHVAIPAAAAVRVGIRRQVEGGVSTGTALLGCNEDRGAGRGVTVHHPQLAPQIRTVLVRHRVAQHTVPGFRQQRWAALSQLARESAAVRRSTGPRAAPLAPARQRTVQATVQAGYESTRPRCDYYYYY